MKTCVFIRRIIFSVSVLLFSSQLSALEQDLVLTDPANALQQYVDYEDNMFNMQHIVSLPGAGYNAHLYNLTSQKWLTDAAIDRRVWSHSLVIVVPDVVNIKTGLLFVAGDDNTDPLPDGGNPTIQIITQLAIASQSIVSAVFQVPNQPIVFENNAIPTKEDKLVAISWKNAINTGNFTNTAYLPMVKSVVKAMDGIQSVIADHGDYQIDNFVLTGFSKRGATVWLSAAIDLRVKAIAPGVIDFLNIVPSFEHHYRSYGEFSSAIEDYVELKITDDLRAPEFSRLARVIDPYAYLDKLHMPKFLLNSSGDQFFLPDSSRFYFNELQGENLIRFAPNTDHSLGNSITGVNDSLYSLLGWYQSVLYGIPRPEINWQVNHDELVAQTNQSPIAVKVWSAYNDASRDFRKESIGESWVSKLIPVNATGEYKVSLPQSDSGFHATYIEFIYPGLSGLPVTYSTQVYVTPDVYLFELDDFVFNPKSSAYWKWQIRFLLKGYDTEVQESDWLSYLPVPLFDGVVSDIDRANEVLTAGRKFSVDGRAQRECLATRLNIRAGELGWYSTVDLGGHLGEKPLWKHYKMAHDNVENLPFLSAYICYQLNKS